LTFSLAHRINIPSSSHRHFSSLARRLGRIFAHAYFHHREVFEQAEAESSLYARFLALTCKFDLVPPDFLIIPTPSMASDDPEPPRLLAAAVDPQHLPGPEDDSDDRGRGVHRGLSVDILGGIDRNPSPRKGRNRTGTMIFSEALIMAEELGKDGHSPSPERESMTQMSGASSGINESDSDFVHVDVSNRGGEEEEPSAEDHEGYMGVLTEVNSRTYDLPEEDHHVTGIPDIHMHPDAVQDHHEAPEQDVTDDAELESGALAEARGEPADEDDPEHDVASAHGAASGTTIIELPSADEIDALEEDAHEEEEDLTEAVVEPHDDDVDAADAQEVDEQIDLDEPQDQAADAV
jgi:Mob1/phocein family